MSGTALVTGSAGFVGRHMVSHLRDIGWEVTGVDVMPSPYGWQADMGTWLHGDRCVYDLVVHAAARSPHRRAIDTAPAMHLYNQMIDAQLLEWAARTGQGRVLYLSSCAAADWDPDAYGHTKLTGERLAQYVRQSGTPVTIVRPYSGYGEDQSEDFPFRAIVERARRREDPFVLWGSGEQVRDWIHIDDVVAGALALAQAGVDGPVSLCTGVGTSIRELAEAACEFVGYTPTFDPHPELHAGSPMRVGDPTVLYQHYQPRVTYVAEGVYQALQGGITRPTTAP